jgi:hypothetical protein
MPYKTILFPLIITSVTSGTQVGLPIQFSEEPYTLIQLCDVLWHNPCFAPLIEAHRVHDLRAQHPFFFV